MATPRLVRTGDLVRDMTTGKSYVVAYVQDERYIVPAQGVFDLMPIADFEMMKIVSQAESERVLQTLSAISDPQDMRRLYAERVYRERTSQAKP